MADNKEQKKPAQDEDSSVMDIFKPYKKRFMDFVEEKSAGNPEVQDELKKKKFDPDFWKSGFPSDEELQAVKKERRDWLDKVRKSGYPGTETIANVGEKISDAITPDTRDEYIQGLVPAIGSIEKVGANAANKVAQSPGVRDNLRKLARSFGSEESAALEKSPQALKGLTDKLKSEGIYTKQGELQRAADISKIRKAQQVRSNPTAVDDTYIKGQGFSKDIKPAAEPRTIDYGKQGPLKVKSDLEKLEGPTYNKMNRNPSEAVKSLQQEMEMANRAGDYKKAKDILEQIRATREKVGY